MQAFLRNVAEKYIHSISFIPTLVQNPKGNGKKEREHRDDLRDFWQKNRSNDLKYISKKFEKYLKWRNKKKGHFALEGKPSITHLQENKKPVRRFTRRQLENMAKVKIA